MTALRVNAAQLLLMLLLILDMQYVFSILAFRFFPNYFNPALGGAAYCESLIQCLLTLLYFGLPTSGGITQFLPSYFVDPWNGSIPSQSYAMVAFIVVYFSVTGPILLNVTFAIIVDTFGELRESRKAAKDNLGTTCFVCSLERDRFVYAAKDFNVHLEKEHNRLHYLYYFAYLKDLLSRGQTRNDVEIDIINRISQREFLKFFPVGRAKVLETEKKEDETTRIWSTMERLARQIEASGQHTERLIKVSQEANRSEVRALKVDIGAIRRALDPNARNSPGATPRDADAKPIKSPKRDKTLGSKARK